MKEHLMKKLEIIKKSAELLLDHHKSRAVKDNLLEVGLRNIIGISQEAIDEIEKEKASEPLRE
jgi:hypothetical protein